VSPICFKKSLVLFSPKLVLQHVFVNKAATVVLPIKFVMILTLMAFHLTAESAFQLLHQTLKHFSIPSVHWTMLPFQVVFSTLSTKITSIIGFHFISGATGSCTTKDALYNKFCSTTLNPSGIAGSNVPVCGNNCPRAVNFFVARVGSGTSGSGKFPPQNHTIFNFLSSGK